MFVDEMAEACWYVESKWVGIYIVDEYFFVVVVVVVTVCLLV